MGAELMAAWGCIYTAKHTQQRVITSLSYSVWLCISYSNIPDLCYFLHSVTLFRIILRIISYYFPTDNQMTGVIGKDEINAL